MIINMSIVVMVKGGMMTMSNLGPDSIEAIGTSAESLAHATTSIVDYLQNSNFHKRKLLSRNLKTWIKDNSALNDSDLSEKQKSLYAFTYFANSVMHKNDNLQAVLKIYMKFMDESKTSEAEREKLESKVFDKDWLDSFRDIAEKTNHEAKQYLLANVLKNEVKSGKSFSKRALSALDNMDMKEVKAFQEMCSWCITVSEKTNPNAPLLLPIVNLPTLPTEAIRDGLSLETMHILEDADIVQEQTEPAFSVKPSSDIIVNGQQLFPKDASRIGEEFYAGFRLTTIGTELSRICDCGTAKDDFTELVRSRLVRPDYQIEVVNEEALMERVKKEIDNRIYIENQYRNGYE